MFEILTADDCSRLIEAVTEWESAIHRNAMLKSFFTIGTTKDESTLESRVNNIMGDAVERDKIRTEQAILLKAKLLQLRDKLLAEEAARELRDSLS